MSRLTGVLLVGGASRRFGSPKALARFRGETLAERGRRLLAETCDEVLVVGKADELPGLPFPVVDDGADDRAPVHGLVEGLRRAAHDVVVALPVDNPLVTPGALRALGEAGAVPSGRIPLPGAYPRSLLAVLEERIAAGQISLRGVNPVTLALPEALLADADPPEELEALARPGHAVVVGGTGMLLGATRSLAERGHRVTSLARRPADVGEGVVPVAVDYRASDALREALARAMAERGPLELALCWIHTDAAEAPAIVAEAVAPGGRLVQVFGTRRWPLAHVPLSIAYREVLLGAVGGRWPTHAEIAAGVLDAIDADEPCRVVGERG